MDLRRLLRVEVEGGYDGDAARRRHEVAQGRDARTEVGAAGLAGNDAVIIARTWYCPSLWCIVRPMATPGDDGVDEALAHPGRHVLPHREVPRERGRHPHLGVHVPGIRAPLSIFYMKQHE
jgi:hypothetical protein